MSKDYEAMTDLEAIEEACIKWNAVAFRQSEDLGTDNCALCQKHHSGTHKIACNQCPIKKLTRLSGCQNTPYELWNILTDGIPINKVDGKSLLIAQKEFEFLMKLRDTYLAKEEVTNED